MDFPLQQVLIIQFHYFELDLAFPLNYGQYMVNHSKELQQIQFQMLQIGMVKQIHHKYYNNIEPYQLVDYLNDLTSQN